MGSGELTNDQIVFVRMDEMTNELQKVVRRIDVMQKSLDILYKDREILEKIISDISQLKSLVVSNREHQEIMIKDVKSEVVETNDTLQDGISTLSDTIDKNDGKTSGIIDSIKEKMGMK